MTTLVRCDCAERLPQQCSEVERDGQDTSYDLIRTYFDNGEEANYSGGNLFETHFQPPKRTFARRCGCGAQKNLPNDASEDDSLAPA